MKKPEWKTEKDEQSGDVYHEMTLDFGVVDEKGRRVGCVLYVHEVASRVYPTWDGTRYAPKEHPAKIESSVSAQRDGSKFGAIPRSMRHESVEEAKASVLKRGEQSRKRQVKQFGGKA